MSEWMMALIQIEKASKWAIKNSPEVSGYLDMAMKRIKEQYGESLSSKSPTRPQNPIVIKKLSAKPPKKTDTKAIDYSRSAKRLSGLILCNLCNKEHIGCKKYFTKSGSFVIVCIYCEALRLRVPQKKVERERSADLLDHTVAGSYGSGKKR